MEHGVCPIAKSSINELFLKLWSDALRMHETALFSHNYGLKSDATIVFLDPDFLNNAEISAIRTYIRAVSYTHLTLPTILRV